MKSKSSVLKKGLKSKCFKAALVVGAGVFISDYTLATTISSDGSQGVGGTEFQAFYDFILSASTGYLGRSIAIVGGLVGLGMAAFSGKILPAAIGAALAVFGVLGPTIINAIYTSAMI